MRRFLSLFTSLTLGVSGAALAAPAQNPASKTVANGCTEGAVGTVRDEDGNNYKTVCIGGRFWMAENMRYYTGSYSMPGDDTANYRQYGLLYDWETAKTVCPAGWLLPTKDDFDQLFKKAGASDKNSTSLRSKTWAKGSDASSFGAIPAGYATAQTESGGGAANFGSAAYFWTATLKDETKAYNAFVRSAKAGVHYDFTEHTYFSVRCVQDPKVPYTPGSGAVEVQPAKPAAKVACVNGTAGTMQDSDGKTYKTVCINGQTWMAENMKKVPAKGKYYHANNEAANDETYGLLYDWKAARSVCPGDQGWRLPQEKDFKDLLKYVGDNEDDDRAFLSLIAKSPLWTKYSNRGVNDSGFGGLPTGSYFPNNYREFGVAGQWWSAASKGAYEVINLYLFSGMASVVGSSPEYGLSVRCVKE